MPTARQARARGGVVRVRSKRLRDGTILRVYVYGKPGPRGGRTTAEKAKQKGRRR